MITNGLYIMIQKGGKGPVYWVLCFIILLLIIGLFRARWILLKKAGHTPWHALIPLLSDYALYDICWNRYYGIAAFVLAVLLNFLVPKSGRVFASGIKGYLYLLALFIYFVLNCIMKMKLCRSFGKDINLAFGLIFMEEIFCPILAHSGTEYYGRTLRKYNPIKKITESSSSKQKRRYMIALQKSRSYVALFASILTFACCVYAVSGGLIQDPNALHPERGNQLFKLFTVNSNVFAAIGAAMMIPFAVEGVRKKRFAYPKWLQIIQQSGAICTTLTMVFAIFLIYPSTGVETAFLGMNFWLHLVCPIMTLILLFSSENNMELTIYDSFAGLVPFYIYALVYLTNVVFLGEEYGGWRDIYMVATYLPPILSIALLFMLSFGISQVIRIIYNKIVRYRRKKMISQWNDDLTEIDLKIEAYGLGRYNGMYDEISNITTPVDIFLDLAEKYQVTIDELCRAYNKGVAHGLKQREEFFEEKKAEFSQIIGTPEKLATKEE
ncbi:MAG: hypothetical protein IKS51_05310 [Erysipelotrichaceae bacterium]|nr:hypothetical protein [Erysipelotrichaceae bacterium]